jgi:hypothetical protein
MKKNLHNYIVAKKQFIAAQDHLSIEALMRVFNGNHELILEEEE